MVMLTDEAMERGRRPAIVTAAAGAIGFEGAMVALLAIQNLTLVSWIPPYNYFVVLMLLVGGACAALAFRVAKVRLPAVYASLAVSSVLMVVMAGWVGISFSQGVFSLIALVAVAGALGSLALQGVALPYAKEVARIRAALRATGIELDL